MVLVGNKVCEHGDEDVEKERQVETQEAQELADQENISYFEIDEKTNTNIEELMMHIQKMTYEHKKEQMELNELMEARELMEPRELPAFRLQVNRHSESGTKA